jgi:hypothetical protein
MRPKPARDFLDGLADRGTASGRGTREKWKNAIVLPQASVLILIDT